MMIGQIMVLLGGDERALRIARKIMQIEMWVSAHEMRWFLAQLDSVIERGEKALRRAA